MLDVPVSHSRQPIAKRGGTLAAFMLLVAAAKPPSAVGAVGVPALRLTAPNGATSLLIGSLHEAADGWPATTRTERHGRRSALRGRRGARQSRTAT